MIAVTGAAGFIGSNLAHRLTADGHRLLLVDQFVTPAKLTNLVGLPNVNVLRHDEFVTALRTGQLQPDAIFHLGACSETTACNWAMLQQNNIEYSQLLWEWCARNLKPFYYASSAATYGDGSRGFDDRTPPEQLQPLNLYGKSKNEFDRWALAQSHRPPRWAGFKFFNVYGPREGHKGRMASVVWQTHRQIRETGIMRLFRSNNKSYSDGGQLRDFVFVDDCVDHMMWLWQHAAPSAIYNSGTGQARTFADLVRATYVALGKKPMIEFIDMPADITKQYQNFTQAEMGKLRDAGYTNPATNLEEGVARTVASYSHRAAA